MRVVDICELVLKEVKSSRFRGCVLGTVPRQDHMVLLFIYAENNHSITDTPLFLTQGGYRVFIRNAITESSFSAYQHDKSNSMNIAINTMLLYD